MHKEIVEFNNNQATPEEKQVCETLATLINEFLPDGESKIWHRHPVWFLNGNPIVGYSKLKSGVRLTFWSGASFDEEKFIPGTGKFQDASVMFTHPDQIDQSDLRRWIEKSKTIQWDYKNVAKRKGKIVRLQ